MQKSVLKRALGLGTDVADGVRIEGESIIVAAGPRRAAPRCPVRGRRCDGYDALPARRWRAPDVGSARCYVEHVPRRVECPEHGVKAGAVPWARTPSSRFTSVFEDQVARLAPRMRRSALAELMRVDWRAVGGICARAGASLEEADGRGGFDGPRSIGVDEASYEKGREYMTVVVDRDRGRVAWACAGHGKRQPNAFLDLLTDARRAGIGVVTANGVILRSIALGVSNARVEAVNSKIKVAIRQGYGFRNADDLIALIMLRCSDPEPALPGRATA